MNISISQLQDFQSSKPSLKESSSINLLSLSVQKPSNSNKKSKTFKLTPNLSQKQVINIHRTSSTSRITPDPFSKPSIISSVLHLKQKQLDPLKTEIHNFQGGGFRGNIKKSLKSLKFLPKFELPQIPKHKKTHSQSDMVRVLKKYSNIQFKSSSGSAFKANVQGRRLSLGSETSVFPSESHYS
jgi:hypothetical protein